MDNFERNQNHTGLPEVDVGDSVVLKCSNGLGYLLMCRVEESAESKIIAMAMESLTLDGSQINNGHGTKLPRKTLEFQRDVVHAVIKRSSDA